MLPLKIDKDLLILHYSVVLAAVFCSLVLRQNGIKTGTAVGVGVLLGLAIEGLFFWSLRAVERRAKQYKEEIAQLEALPLSEVRARVTTILGTGSECPFPMPEGLTESQIDFFRHYDGAQLGDGLPLTLQCFGPSGWMPEYVVLGGSYPTEIIARLGEDRVCETDAPLTEAQFLADSYPTIWHFFLANSGVEATEMDGGAG